MEIRSLNNLSFGTKVEAKFIRRANSYYHNRSLPTQQNSFNKTVERLELLGDEDSFIFYLFESHGKEKLHKLCFKNVRINDKEGLLLTQSPHFKNILEFFTKLNDDVIQKYEQML